jgi:hypothetical protein
LKCTPSRKHLSPSIRSKEIASVSILKRTLSRKHPSSLPSAQKKTPKSLHPFRKNHQCLHPETHSIAKTPLTRQAVHKGVHEGAARKEEGAAPTVKAAVEASVLLRSVRKLRSELMKLRREEVSRARRCRVRKSCVQGSVEFVIVEFVIVKTLTLIE